MISVSNVSYSYQGSHRKVFDKFSLSFSEDGIYGLLGRNGTGKSTLLYLMSGLLRPSSGSVSVDGFNAFQRSPEMLSDIFLVPDTVYFPDCTLHSYISSNGCFYPRFSEELLRKCLSDFGMDTDVRLSALSFGQKKKVLVSFAIATGVHWLFMDEPANGLDIPSQSLFRKIIADSIEPGRSLILSTHQVHGIENLLDHVVIIDGSRVLVNAGTGDITSRYRFLNVRAGDAVPVLYSEPSAMGSRAIVRRDSGDGETILDLELFFNAVISGKIVM